MLEVIMKQLESLHNPHNIEGMARFGIRPKKTFGVSITDLRNIAKSYKGNHRLALELWEQGYRETRIISSLIDDPTKVTEQQLENWVVDLDCWDVCDQVCKNLFEKTPFAYKKARKWMDRDETFVKRAGFVTIAWLAVHEKKVEDDVFFDFFPQLIKHTDDERLYVKKAISWAFRQIGKRSLNARTKVLDTVESFTNSKDKSTRWIGKDVVKDLNNLKLLERLNKKNNSVL